VEERRIRLGSSQASGSEEGIGVHLIAATLPLSYAVQLGPKQSALSTTLLDAFGDSHRDHSVLAIIDFVNQSLPRVSQNAIGFSQVPLTSSIGLDFLLIP
jgi:hypothetical protein